MTSSLTARITRLAVVAVAALGLAACGINSVPTKEEEAKAQWGTVESAYQRRADLIPNLVETVKAAAGSENQILTNVVEARARATSINITTDDLSNPEEFAKFQAAQNQLTQALGQLRTVVEAYPQLQSQQDFKDLMVALEGAENQVNVERIRYNEKARDYNTEIRTFPSIMAAKIVYGAKPMEYFKADEGAKEAPKVDFGGMAGAPSSAAPAK
ncbi:MAG TPA: LemA family protein [Sphingomonadaceae bacterium]|uniref:LemA family protein n=1 Tax=Altererythrobacter sp. CC-YST694 TaxID=2755038 RepID=UPI001D0029FB|nr:LemA family protein [Altererythrobacter sp. CC-YST694]MCB5424989.1 LemA family protein [Altererythrobacter sp. CC-YST694]HZF45008.1 LemA family protein [Sphingomonadaceae bacterium]